MTRTQFKTIDEYIASFPEDVQAVLEELRGTIRKAAPEAEEKISYQIPTFTRQKEFSNELSFMNKYGPSQ
jgi:uncharacterized protein YdhG (YjbR/CyaY superfamily)